MLVYPAALPLSRQTLTYVVEGANRAHARLRAPGERANAQLKSWHIMRGLRCCPWRAGQRAKAARVLQARESHSGAAPLQTPGHSRDNRSAP
jgi:hypothetical protein